MPGDLGDFLGASGYETWTGFELVFDSLEAQGVSTLQNLAIFHSLGYFLGGCH